MGWAASAGFYASPCAGRRDPDLPGGSAGEYCQALDVMRHRERVVSAQAGQLPAAIEQPPQVPGQRRRITGHVSKPPQPGRSAAERVDHRRGRAGSRRIKYRDRGIAQSRARQYRRSVTAVHSRPRPRAQVMPCVTGSRLVVLDSQYHPVRPDRLGQQPGEQAGPAIQVQRYLARPRVKSGQYRLPQDVRRTRMHLPEAAEAYPPVAPGRAAGEITAATRCYRPLGATPRNPPRGPRAAPCRYLHGIRGYVRQHR